MSEARSVIGSRRFIMIGNLKVTRGISVEG
jgi:hypothetical protein